MLLAPKVKLDYSLASYELKQSMSPLVLRISHAIGLKNLDEVSFCEATQE